MGAPNASTSSVSDDSYSGFTVDSSIINKMTLPTDPHLLILLEDIEIEIEQAKTERTLPSQWSLSDFSLIGKVRVKDCSYLIDVENGMIDVLIWFCFRGRLH